MEKELSILLTDDPTIAELNGKYLGRAGPTNVIAFPMQEGPYAEISPDLLGDVVISTETMCRQAQEAGLPVLDVLERLLVHGILHLVGHDHAKSREDGYQMEQREQQVIRALREEDGSMNQRRLREVR
jgi:probable rRNA maturation factor